MVHNSIRKQQDKLTGASQMLPRNGHLQ